MQQITKKLLRKLCLDHDLYGTPELNEILYLHYKGFEKIENLTEYVNVKALFLQSNAISKIENLEPCRNLRSLVLEHNCISKIENLEFAKDLDTLNLEGNIVTHVSGLSQNTKLQTLNLAGNQIHSAEGLKGLLECPSITCLDLRKNKMENPVCLETLHKMPNLRVLYMKGNPLMNKVKDYRKTAIAKITTLRYLDDRPVFEDERRLAEAWFRGGREEEKLERVKMKNEKEEKRRRKFECFEKLVGEAVEDSSLEDKVISPVKARQLPDIRKPQQEEIPEIVILNEGNAEEKKDDLDKNEILNSGFEELD